MCMTKLAVASCTGYSTQCATTCSSTHLAFLRLHHGMVRRTGRKHTTSGTLLLACLANERHTPRWTGRPTTLRIPPWEGGRAAEGGEGREPLAAANARPLHVGEPEAALVGVQITVASGNPPVVQPHPHIRTAPSATTRGGSDAEEDGCELQGRGSPRATRRLTVGTARSAPRRSSTGPRSSPHPRRPSRARRPASRPCRPTEAELAHLREEERLCLEHRRGAKGAAGGQ
jgi:hypothetical protein